MTTEVATVEPRSVLRDMADRFGMEPANFEQTLKATIVPSNCSREQLAAFLLVAKQYNLNPITKEIFAFPRPGGGIQPVVSVDGWCNLINSHPQTAGIEFDDHRGPDGSVTSITCRIWRKDRDKPVSVTEYMTECRRDTDVWKRWPRRMLRHKALIQCARYSFGFAGIVDPDEAERETPAERQVRRRPPLAERLRSLASDGDPSPVEVIDEPPPAEDHDPDTGELVDPPDEHDADFQRGVSDAKHGLMSCLSSDICKDAARLDRWRAGWHSVVGNEPPPQVHDTLDEKSDHGRLKG